MKTSQTFRALVIAVFAVLIGGTLIASGPVAVEQTSVSGNLVVVTIHNSGTQTENVMVTVTALVAGLQVQNVAPASVAAGESLDVPTSFGNPIEEIIQVGIINDDGSPF